MIAIIRIKGDNKLPMKVRETLYRLRLRRKYVCVVLEKPTAEQLGMIKSVRDFVAFGNIDEDTYKELVEKRGQKTKDGLKPFFRLHPPRKGIDSKKHFGVNRGVLGNNKEAINDLIRRML